MGILVSSVKEETVYIRWYEVSSDNSESDDDVETGVRDSSCLLFRWLRTLRSATRRKKKNDQRPPPYATQCLLVGGAIDHHILG